MVIYPPINFERNRSALHDTWNAQWAEVEIYAVLFKRKGEKLGSTKHNFRTFSFYIQLKETLLLAFLAQNRKGVTERELWGTLQESNEYNWNFRIKKLELIKKLKLAFNNREKVDLILVSMLPLYQEKLEERKPETITKLIEVN